uniref:Uncharacterized protein n=1 Tax=Moniliophthora roreri TaxID=221103 RepID=A0A0W0FGY5_MONRR
MADGYRQISVLPDTFVYITFYSTLARFYSTSFLATLNARKHLRASNKSGNASGFIGSVSLTFDPPGSTTMEATRVHDIRSYVPSDRRITIKQDIETMVHSDYELKSARQFFPI